MSSETRDFPGLPTFPKDVPTAPLLCLSLQKLLASDESEIKRLIEACEDLGFFYLDLQNCGPASGILDDVDKLFAISKEFYSLSLEEKKKYDFSAQNSYFGYKSQGAVVVDKNGTRDRNESYNVPKIDMLGMIDALPRPRPFDEGKDVFASFMKRSHSIVTLLLDIFNESLGLSPGTLSALHRIDAMSGDAVRLIKAPPQPRDDRKAITLPEHTDYGSITFVFNQLGGLQVLPPGKDAEYLYVEPLPGHMIVNIGDALAKFTNGLFRSNIHRIVAPPGVQGDFTRYSVVYFSRPNDDVILKRLEGSERIPPLEEGTVEEIINSKDWILRRGLGRRATQAKVDLDKCAGTENLSRRIVA